MTHVPKSLRGMNRFKVLAHEYLREKLTEKQYSTIYIPGSYTFHIVIYTTPVRFLDSLILPELNRLAEEYRCDLRVTSINADPSPGMANMCCVVKRLDGGG